MKYKVPILLVVLSFLLTACGESPSEVIDYDVFAYNLRGTWEPNESPGLYPGEGTLVITYNRITISGFPAVTEIIIGYNDNNHRPFRDFTKGTPLTGYSEDGRLHIRDRSTWQPGIPYTYHESEGWPLDQFLTFNFGGQQYTLKKTKVSW